MRTHLGPSCDGGECSSGQSKMGGEILTTAEEERIPYVDELSSKVRCSTKDENKREKGK